MSRENCLCVSGNYNKTFKISRKLNHSFLIGKLSMVYLWSQKDWNWPWTQMVYFIVLLETVNTKDSSDSAGAESMWRKVMDGFIILMNDLRHRSRRNEKVSYCTFDSTLKTRRTTRTQNVLPELLLKTYQAYQMVIILVRSFLSGYYKAQLAEV